MASLVMMPMDYELEARTEVEKAKQHLAEVIDECLFAERQRDTAERKLRELQAKATNDISELLRCLEAMADYVGVLEHRVVVPAIGALHQTAEDNTTIVKAKDMLQMRLDGLQRSPAFKGKIEGVLRNMEPLPAAQYTAIRAELLASGSHLSLEDSYIAVQGLIEASTSMQQSVDEAMRSLGRYVAEGQSRSVSVARNDDIRELREKVSSLSAQLREHEEEKKEAALRFATLQSALNSESSYQEMERLRSIVEQQGRTISSLKRDLSVSAQRENASTFDAAAARGTVSDAPGEAEFLGGARKLGEEADKSLAAELRAYEMTVAALNSEIAALEESLSVQERRIEAERASLLHELSEERRRHKEEMDECDGVLGRITTELEQLIKENAQLKQRIRAKRNASSPS